MEPCYSTQVHQQHDEFRRLQWQLQKARVQNLGEELASLLQCRSEPDFLSPWCSTTSFHDTLDNKGTSFTDAAFWESSLVCYVLGSRPPLKIMKAFVKRLWGKKGLDKVVVAPNGGCFLARFDTVEACSSVVDGGGFRVVTLDGGPVVVKRWNPEVNLRVPIWIRLPHLDLKYWGLDCVGRIVGGVGRVLEVDYASACRERLQFARVLIEVEVGQRFPELVRFEDDKGEEIEQRVEYEWKPSVCCRCEGIGHGDLECKLAPKRDVAGKKVWRIKKDGRRISRKPGFDGGIRS